MHTARVHLPSVRLTNPAFVYRRADNTNIAETFARVRAQLKQQDHAQALAQRREKRQAKTRAEAADNAALTPTLPLFDAQEAIPC